MPGITLKVSYATSAYQAIVAERGADAALPAFSISSLTALGVYPCEGDLLVDKVMTENTLRVAVDVMLCPLLN